LVQKRADLKSVAAQLFIPLRVQPADGATSFRPHALRNGLLGGVLGVLLGVAVAVANRQASRLAQPLKVATQHKHPRATAFGSPPGPS
jgi:hypothetical protein